MQLGLGKVISSISCDQHIPVKEPAPKPSLDFVAYFFYDLLFICCLIFVHPFILILPCVDGGEEHIFVEKNGNKRGRGREKNGKEHR